MVTSKNRAATGVVDRVEDHRAAGLQHAAQLGDHAGQVGHVLEHLAGDDQLGEPSPSGRRAASAQTGTTP